MRPVHLAALTLALCLALPCTALADASIGLSYAQATRDLGEHFVMSQSTPVNGQPRLFGMTADKLAILEVIGDLNNLTSATLILAIPKDAPAVVRRNSALLQYFARNATRNWSGSARWTVAALKRTQQTDQPVSIIRGSNRLTLTLERPLGFLMISIKHR